MNKLREAISDAIEKPVDAVAETGWPKKEFEEAINDVLDAIIEALPEPPQLDGTNNFDNGQALYYLKVIKTLTEAKDD